MSWVKSAEIFEETYAGPSTEKGVVFDGVFERKIDLASMGTWQTLWVVMLISAEVDRKDCYAPATPGSRTIPGPNRFTWGMRASTSAYPPLGDVDPTYGYTKMRQFLGAHGTLATEPNVQKDSGGASWFGYSEWKTAAREDGTYASISGGYQVALSTDSPATRRPFALAIRVAPANTEIGLSLPQTIPAADITKAACKTWLLGAHASTTAFIAARPTGNTYNPPSTIGWAIDQATYGELDTMFFCFNKPGFKLRCHGIWGRAFNYDL